VTRHSNGMAEIEKNANAHQQSDGVTPIAVQSGGILKKK
jgi:hypothetical protein